MHEMTIERHEPQPRRRELALINQTTDSWVAVLQDVVDLADHIAATEFVPLAMRGSVPKVVAAIMHGRELGLPPMTALGGSNVINGRPGISAELMRALIVQAGHDLRVVESSDVTCTLRVRRKEWGADEWVTFTFTMEDAARRGLLADKFNRQTQKSSPSMFKIWPAEMLLARATTRCARAVFADVIHGMRAIEELDDLTDDGLVGGGMDVPTAATVSVSRQPAGAADGGPEPGVAGSGAGAASAGDDAAPATPAPTPAPAPAPARKRAPSRRERAAQAPAAPAAASGTEAGESTPQIGDSGEDIVDAEVVETRRGDPDDGSTGDGSEPDASVDRTATADDVPSNVRPLRPEQHQDGTHTDPPGEPVMRRSLQAAIMHFARLGVTEREERVYWTGILAGRPIESSNDLTSAELRSVLVKLERLRDRAALEATIGKDDPQ